MSRPAGTKVIPLTKFGFVRAPEEDFTDDGARFTAYWYDPQGTGDKTFRLTKTTYDGQAYISVRYSLPGTRTTKYINKLNGVSIDAAIEGLPDLVKEIEDTKAKISTFAPKTLTAEEIDEISTDIAKAATRQNDYKITAEVLKSRGINKEDLDEKTAQDLEAAVDVKIRAKTTATLSKNTLKALAKDLLRHIIYMMGTSTKFRTADDVLNQQYISASAKDEDGNYVHFSDLDKATQDRMKAWARTRFEADDFE